jgi:hypothetical protein
MSSETDLVGGGIWHGQRPVPENQRLIAWLNIHRVSPRYLQMSLHVNCVADGALEESYRKEKEEARKRVSDQQGASAQAQVSDEHDHEDADDGNVSCAQQ